MPRAGKYTLSGFDTRTARSPSGPGTVSSTAGERVGLIGLPSISTTSPATALDRSDRRYLGDMARRDPADPGRPDAWLDDELLGLDLDDPEVQAFAAHLDRMHRERPTF